ncbi:MAG TPA: thioesterase family protein [Aeromonadales bacterium]|nr:thioesterase family protein [Aeromonadales bacterium]
MREQSKQDLYQKLSETFIKKVPFNQHIGLELGSVSKDKCELIIKMKPELIGNFHHGILHGGVIATTLDSVGGTMAAIGLLEKETRLEFDHVMQKLAKLGTIDMRVDYLLPGKGEKFRASARLLRVGNKVAVTRSEFHNEKGEILALGTATYLVG